MVACQNGHNPCTRELIEAGGNLESKMNSGHTALMLAASGGHDPCARALIEAGAAVDATQAGRLHRLDACVPERSRSMRSGTDRGGGGH